MYSLTLTLEGTSTRKLFRTLQVTQQRLGNLTPAWNVAADNLERWVKLNIQSGGTLSRKRWRGHRRSTLLARRRGWGYYRRTGLGLVSGRAALLQWTGRFKRAFRKGSPDHIRTITPTSLHWGARIHFSRGEGSMMADARLRSVNLRRRIPLKFANTGDRAQQIFVPIVEYVREAVRGTAAA